MTLTNAIALFIDISLKNFPIVLGAINTELSFYFRNRVIALSWSTYSDVLPIATI